MIEEDSTIRRMSETLASQVAAGEVVERPASVVKELVENSIDAQARAIRVEITRGGIASIKVQDDGAGMSRADLALCLERHATSKLTTYEDLFNIRQMGFRGEALPSIASVAQMSITTRRRQDIEGFRLESNGGELTEIRSAGCPPGTEIEVRELFYNTPVRRKFLKSEDTQASHVEQQLRLHALAFPDIRFTFIRDGGTIFDTAATTDLRHRIAEFFGRDNAQKLLRIRPTTGMGIRVEGYLMPLTDARRNRRLQYIYLNSRPIEDKMLTRAVRDGYGGFPTGLQPGYFLYLEVEPALVDVNVHPAKREVRFRRPADITSAVMDAVSATLTDHARGETTSLVPAKPDTPSGGTPASVPPPDEEASPIRPALRLVVEPQQQELGIPAQPSPSSPAQGPVAPAGRPAEDSDTPAFRHLGNIHGQYALFENAEGLVLLSMRAARERIVFERIVSANKSSIPSQQLLTPAMVELDTRDVGLVKDLQPLFLQAGFRVQFFGERTLRVDSLPIFLSLDKVDDFIAELIEAFSNGETKLKRSRDPYELFAIRLAQRYVMREDMTAWLHHPGQLLHELLHCEIPYCTPRGKPTMIPLSINEIQRRFQAL